MENILTWIGAHLGVSLVGTALLSAAVGLFGNKIIKAACNWLGGFLGKQIAAVENLATGDPRVDGLLNLSVLALMHVANLKMPAAPGEDKKKFVMSHFAKLDPAVQKMLSAAIDQLWLTWKQAVDSGVTAPQEAILLEAVDKLKALKAPSDHVPGA